MTGWQHLEPRGRIWMDGYHIPGVKLFLGLVRAAWELASLLLLKWQRERRE